MFRAIILPIFRSARLCVTALWYNAPTMLPATGRQHRECNTCISQAVTHSLALLKMGKIIARNMLSWLELLINRYCCIYLAVYIIYINDARSSKYQNLLFFRCYFRPSSIIISWEMLLFFIELVNIKMISQSLQATFTLKSPYPQIYAVK